jgi:hypothetical protein
MYELKKINDINVARSTTFTNAYGRNDNEDVFYLEKGIDGSMFPPCKSELHQHFLRTSYINDYNENNDDNYDESSEI